MNEKEKLNYLKNKYDDIEIPDELEFIVEKAIKESHKDNKQVENPYKSKVWKKSVIAASAAFAIFVTSVNINPTFADALIDIPFVGPIVKVFVLENYIVKENGFDADIKIPNISGLDDEKLEGELNEKFINQGKLLYEDFIEQMDKIKEQGKDGHIALDTTYEVKTDNDTVFSIILIKTEIMASSNVEYTSYTIDKKNKAIVTLESLFKNDSYIKLISDNIKQQMREQMKNDENIMYFIDNKDMPETNFESINKNQKFYINDDGKVVILFNEYEVAPGYMGALEFVVPTEIIKDILLDRELIK